MAIQLEPYTEERIPTVSAFNGRLREAGIPFQFPEQHCSSRFPKRAGATVYEEYYLAMEGDVARGGYILKNQTFTVRGESRPGAFCRLPISEGIISKKYALVGVRLIQDAARRRPLLLATGMGGADAPVARLLKALGWGMHEVPFYFRVARPFRFLRGIVHLRRTRLRRAALDLLALTGLGWLGVRVIQAPLPARSATRCDLVERFDAWADEVWAACRDHYILIANRDSATLNALYPPENERFLRLRVLSGERTVGWAVLLDTPMSENKYFGHLRVGSIADNLATPVDAPLVMRTATRFLHERGVDLVVTNQSHDAWCGALRRTGYLLGRPSNFLFGVSHDALKLLEPFEANKHLVHITRGDGDGPIH
ncbi:MAG: hypothetical protein ACT4PO_16550, partial [Actinomycetota bacterium]